MYLVISQDPTWNENTNMIFFEHEEAEKFIKDITFNNSDHQLSIIKVGFMSGNGGFGICGESYKKSDRMGKYLKDCMMRFAREEKEDNNRVPLPTEAEMSREIVYSLARK